MTRGGYRLEKILLALMRTIRILDSTLTPVLGHDVVVLLGGPGLRQSPKKRPGPPSEGSGAEGSSGRIPPEGSDLLMGWRLNSAPLRGLPCHLVGD